MSWASMPVRQVKKHLRRFRGDLLAGEKAKSRQGMWEPAFSWATVGIVVPLIICFGWFLLGIANPQYALAKASFSVAAALLVLRICWWLAIEGPVSSKSSKASAAIWSFLVFGTIGCVWVLSLRWVNNLQASAQTKIPVEEKADAKQHLPPSLRMLFEHDWPTLCAFYTTSRIEIRLNGVPLDAAPSKAIQLAWKLEGDFSARSRFLVFFIDDATPPAEAHLACQQIAINHRFFINTADSNVDIIGKFPGDTSGTHFRDMVFSNRIFVYYQHPDFSLEMKGDLEGMYNRLGLSIQFRGLDYLLAHLEDKIVPRPNPLVDNDIILPGASIKGMTITATNLNKGQ